MLRRFLVLVVSASTLAAVPSSAGAQLMVYGGASMPETPLETGYHVGAAFRIRFLLGLRTDINLTNLGQEDGGDAALIGLSETIHWDLPFPGRLTPFVMAGATYHRVDYQGANVDSEDLWGMVGGAGLRVGQRLFLEARYTTFGDGYMVPIVLGFRF